MKRYLLYLFIGLLIAWLLYYLWGQLSQTQAAVPRFVRLQAERQLRIARHLLAEERLHD